MHFQGAPVDKSKNNKALNDINKLPEGMQKFNVFSNRSQLDSGSPKLIDGKLNKLCLMFCFWWMVFESCFLIAGSKLETDSSMCNYKSESVGPASETENSNISSLLQSSVDFNKQYLPRKRYVYLCCFTILMNSLQAPIGMQALLSLIPDTSTAQSEYT